MHTHIHTYYIYKNVAFINNRLLNSVNNLNIKSNVLHIFALGEAHAFKGRDRFEVMISFFVILVAFLLFNNYLQ